MVNLELRPGESALTRAPHPPLLNTCYWCLWGRWLLQKGHSHSRVAAFSGGQMLSSRWPTWSCNPMSYWQLVCLPVFLQKWCWASFYILVLTDQCVNSSTTFLFWHLSPLFEIMLIKLTPIAWFQGSRCKKIVHGLLRTFPSNLCSSPFSPEPDAGRWLQKGCITKTNSTGYLLDLFIALPHEKKKVRS